MRGDSACSGRRQGRLLCGEALPVMFNSHGLRGLLLAGGLDMSRRIAQQVAVVRLE